MFFFIGKQIVYDLVECTNFTDDKYLEADYYMGNNVLDISDYRATNYVDFSTFKINWNKLKNDLNYICNSNYTDIKLVELTTANLVLSRKITVYSSVENFSDIYIGIDIDGIDVNFMFCKYPDFEHYSFCKNLIEFADVMYKSIML